MLAKVHTAWVDASYEQLREPLRSFLACPLPSAKVNKDSLCRIERLHEATCAFWEAAGVARLAGLNGQGMGEDTLIEGMRNLCVAETEEYRTAKTNELDAIRSVVLAKN